MAATLPPAVTDLTGELAKLPGIGRKSALRMALYLLKAPRDYAERLSRAVLDVKDKVAMCSVCGHLSEQDPCEICTNPKRDQSLVCVVEQPGDIIAMEKGNIFNGLYHVLGVRWHHLMESDLKICVHVN